MTDHKQQRKACPRFALLSFFYAHPTLMQASRGFGHKKSLQLSLQALSLFALRDRGRIRTFNRLIRSQVLYPVELHGHRSRMGWQI